MNILYIIHFVFFLFNYIYLWTYHKPRVINWSDTSIYHHPSSNKSGLDVGNLDAWQRTSRRSLHFGGQLQVPRNVPSRGVAGAWRAKTWYIFEAWEKGLPETRRVCTPKMGGIGFAKGNFIISFFLFNHPFSGANC